MLQHTSLLMLCVQGFVGRALGDPGLKPTVRVGEAALREVAAFLLDHDGFAKVRNLLCPPSLLPRAIRSRELVPTVLDHPCWGTCTRHISWLNKGFTSCPQRAKVHTCWHSQHIYIG